MSRVTLLAYDLPMAPTRHAPAHHARTRQAHLGSTRPDNAGGSRAYRLLGDRTDSPHSHTPDPIAYHARHNQIRAGFTGWTHAGPEQPAPPHAAARFRWRVGIQVWLSAAVIVLVGLVGLVAPVLARAHQGGRVLAEDFVLSGYTELSTGRLTVAHVTQQPGAIDATTRQAPPPQVEQPAPASTGSQALMPTGQPYEVVGPPSISVPQIEAVLQAYSSPAAGLGQKLYDLGVRYGIDPAFALAFFVHESACGTRGVARFTHSLGNIRWTEGYENYEGYRRYPTWEAGFEDWYKLITELYIGQWNLRTIDQIVPVYAPWGDGNHPPTYITSIKSMVDQWREQSAGQN